MRRRKNSWARMQVYTCLIFAVLALLAAYAGAAIAKANPIKTGITATRLAITAFIIPYIFVFNPTMLFIDATVLQVITIVFTSLAGMFALAAGLEGYMFRHMTIPERIIITAAGLLLINPSWITNIIGFSIIALSVIIEIIGKRFKKQTIPEIDTEKSA